MEVREVITRLLGSERQSRFESEAISKIADVKSEEDPILTHVGPLEKRDEILREGLLSRKMAKRLGKKDFDTRWGGRGSPPEWPEVYFRKGLSFAANETAPFFGVLVKPVGLIFSESGEQIEDLASFPLSTPNNVVTKYRVSPREYVGFLLSGKQENFEDNVKKLVNSMRRTGLSLPIYNMNGDLLWPQRMSHSEIVQMLADKGKRDEVV